MFSTDDAGHVEAEVATESQGMLEEFVGYIKSHKVVVLEDLAAHFSLKTEAAVQRVKELEVRGRIGQQPISTRTRDPTRSGTHKHRRPSLDRLPLRVELKAVLVAGRVCAQELGHITGVMDDR